MLNKILYVVAVFFLLIVFMPVNMYLFALFNVYHPIGQTASYSAKTGRTHYVWLRPFSNKFTPIFDIGIPVKQDVYIFSESPAFDLPGNRGFVKKEGVWKKSNWPFA